MVEHFFLSFTAETDYAAAASVYYYCLKLTTKTTKGFGMYPSFDWSSKRRLF